MSVKTYLSNQIRLITLSTYDLFTEEESKLYFKIVETINKIDKLETDAIKDKTNIDSAQKKELVAEKKEYQQLLAKEIKKHNGVPRTVRLESILDLNKFKDHDGNINLPPGITWKTLKYSRRIAEFSSSGSRSLGLNHLDITFDKIIVKWKSLDILKQIIYDGFYVPILNKDGTVIIKHYRYLTSSAGQLRTDKAMFISDDGWEKIKDKTMCGLTWEKINEHKGINIGKYLAYMALPWSATDKWDFDIDKSIVIKDFEAEVTGVMDYINEVYEIERGERTVVINHCDGIGMALPGVLPDGVLNAQCRGPWLKGLLTTFDYIEFCKFHNKPPIIKDYYGVEHDLIKEDIKVIFTESQFKLAKYYKDWDEYKKYFKQFQCEIGLTNYEEFYIKDTDISYQMLQTLVCMTDKEINIFTQPTHDKIENLAKDKATMLRTLRADIDSEDPMRVALILYPELLRDGYCKETLKAIKKRATLDAMSGAIRCKNKRLFAIPDMYAACEFWFLGIEHPEGILKADEVFSRIHLSCEEGDILRSPH